MDPTDRLVAIVAGSLAGLIVLLAVVALIIYCCIRSRKKTKRKNPRHFAHHQLAPHSESSLSKHSTLSQPDPRKIDPRDPRFMDPRLPKVGSSNLWFGTPSLYSGGPSDAYQGLKKSSGNRPPPHAQPALQAPPVYNRPVYFPRAKTGEIHHQSGVYAPPAGHMVYQGRIFHSQHLGAPEIYDAGYRLPRSGSYLDVYGLPYNYDPSIMDMNNSRAVLVDYADPDNYYLDRYREREVRRTGKRVRRSQSDVTLHSTKRPKNRKQRGETPFDKEGKENRDEKREAKRHEDKRDSHEHGHRRRHHSHERVIDKEHTTTAEVHKPRKTAPPPPKPKPYHEEVQSKSLDLIDPESLPSATDSAKLRAIERNREKEQLRQTSTNDVMNDLGKDNHAFNSNENDLNDLYIRPYNYEGKPSKYESPVVAKMAALTDTPRVVRTNQNNTNGIGNDYGSQESFHAEVSRKLEKIQDGVKVDKSVDVEGPVATSTGKHSRSSRPSSSRGHARRGSNVTDQDGKIITAEAFGFLDGYSDGEGTDFLGSGQITPTQVRDYDVNL